MTVGELRRAIEGLRDDMIIACAQGVITGVDVWQLGPLTDGEGNIIDQSGAEEEALFIEIQEV